MKLNYIVAVFATMSLLGCEVNQPPVKEDMYKQVMPETNQAPASQYSEIANAAIGEVQDGWLKNFNDPKLEAIVEEAIRNNLNLQAAVAKLDAASAIAVQAGAELKPVVGIGGQFGNDQLFSNSGYQIENDAIALSMSWELDLWGRIRSQKAAGEAAFEATQYQVMWAYQSIAAQTAKIYYLLTEAQMQQGLAQEAVELYEKTYDIVAAKFKQGQVTQREVSLASANVASGKATVRKAQSALLQASRALEIMLGRYPAAEMAGAKDLSASLPPIPVGLPSELLERRPDIRAAERAAAAQFYQIQKAEAAKLPKVSLTAGVGSVSNDLTQIISLGNNFWSIGTNFVAPIFTGGALEAQVDIESAGYRQAMANYGLTALKAFSEVEQGLANETLLREQQEYLMQVVADSKEALRVTNTQFNVGKVDLLSVIQQQGQLIGAKVNLLNIRDARLLQRIDLHLALGGDFQNTPKVVPE
ncbi:efflux transporter outer membrane subunit [Thalassotalea sp. LPB0316]|uniref:efflux transporter outer membrane subunit n=1 Tax=Thalassotalea sp. LPB0316 TaxID=2769490 RepID=UPI0018663FF3|nr:efflux transporter outer membrane subunit [Thalassotalea sp. LPB0316]QOL27182.1 efflux transporter outer membrane subunit [Thalassotalea sp. LPB0316]